MQAQRLADFELGRKGKPPLRYQTTPHAPLNRRYEQIEGSLLYAVESHGRKQRYRGWIFCRGQLEPILRRAWACCRSCRWAAKASTPPPRSGWCSGSAARTLKQTWRRPG